MTSLVVVENVTRSFARGSSRVEALRGISLSLDGGEVVALVGRSGSDKTILLNVIGGLDRADEETRLRDRPAGHRAAPRSGPRIRRRRLVATHDPALVSFADRVLHLRDGRLENGP